MGPTCQEGRANRRTVPRSFLKQREESDSLVRHECHAQQLTPGPVEPTSRAPDQWEEGTLIKGEPLSKTTLQTPWQLQEGPGPVPN